MAVSAHTTTAPCALIPVNRRLIFRGLLGLGAGAAVISAPAVIRNTEDRAWEELHRFMVWLHPNGAATVDRARAAGFDPTSIENILAYRTDDLTLPAIMFSRPAGACYPHKHYFDRPSNAAAVRGMLAGGC